ncbi:MAG: glycosyltransferase [Muribaculaceae bacterium]|nr:glycosyltransferase [Muribaculaceae bacterium]
MLFTALSLITLLWIIGVGLKPWRRVTTYADAAAIHEARTSSDPGSDRPKVSVVSYVHRDAEALSDYLDLLLAQDYPDLEVVLVCDASAEATAMISERFENVENLHITFIPPGSHNLSRRKLAQTIGIKAAKGEIVLLTSTSVIPVSTSWVSRMILPFTEDSALAVVLGYVRVVPEDYNGSGKAYRRFDHILDSVSWMDAALDDDAFRGDGYNLAFRRRLFFENKGYAATIPLMDGDDDIFIRELSRFGRVRLQLAPSAVVDSRWGDQTDRQHLDIKDRRMFTRHYLPRRPFVRQGMMSCAQWTLLLTALLGIASGLAGWLLRPEVILIPGMSRSLPEIILMPGMWQGICIASAALIALFAGWICEGRTYRRLADALGSMRLMFRVPLFLLWRPLGNALFTINHRTGRKAHFTWQR